MDMSQKAEEKALRGLLTRMDRDGKCVPCRVVFLFSLMVFIGVVVFILVERVREQSALRPVPAELAPQISPSQYQNELLRLEAAFKDPNTPLLSSNPMEHSASTSSLPIHTK